MKTGYRRSIGVTIEPSRPRCVVRRKIAFLPLLLLVSAAMPAAERPPAIDNGQTRLETVGHPGHWTGVRVYAGEDEVTTIELTSGARWVARRAAASKQGRSMSLTMRDLNTSGTGGTPELGRSSFVRFSLTRGEPYPRVDFRLEMRAFDRAAWEDAWSQPCPVHFLRCTSREPEIYYFHGLLAPTPRTDPYPFSWRDMRAKWADGWSTAPAIGALTIPAVALWKPSTGHMVGYSFQHARSTDKSSKHISVAYCWGVRDAPGDAFALIWPYQRGWDELTYPSAPTTVESHFDLLFDLHLGPTDDVNEFVLDHVWSRYSDLLPPVPQMNDLGWMVERHSLPSGAPSPALFRQINKADESFCSQFFRDQTRVFGGDFRAVDLAYRLGDEAELAELRREIDVMLSRALWETIDGDECCYWKHPSGGGWDDWIGGEAADTTHNVQQFGFAGALLAVYLHEPSDRLWRHVEGLYSWARHYVYTRGDICDIPCSMFTLQTSRLALNFLMNLHYSLGDDPDPHKREIAREAFGLAQTVVWRNANVTTDDPDETDTLDPTFLMPGNHAKFWLGQVSWAELCDVFRSMIVMYAETGDLRLKYYVRGALEKWHTGFEADGYHTAENLDVFGETAGKGKRTALHGPQDSFWEWAQPVGESVLRVTAGRAAAIAFCKGTTALDASDYRFRSPANFTFRIAGDYDQPFRMVFSSPFRDLSDLPVVVDGEPALDVTVAGAYHEHLLFTAHAGATVEIGEIAAVDGAAPSTLAEAKAHAVDGRPRSESVLGMECVGLARHCNEEVSRSWDDRASWAGLSAGRAFAHGVPYVIVEPDSNAGKMAVRKESFRLWKRAAGVFLVCSEVKTKEVAVALTTGAYLRVDPRKGLPIRTGGPLQSWELWLYPVSLPKDAEIEEIWVLGDAQLFAVTIDRRNPDTARRVEQVVAKARERESEARVAQAVREEMAFGCSKRVRTQLARKQIRAAFLLHRWPLPSGPV